MFQEITVEEDETASQWIDLATEYAETNADKESITAALGQIVWPASFDQAYITLEFADNDQGDNPGALYATDGTTIESKITKPAAGQRTTLNPAKFSMVGAVRIVLPAAASQDWTWKVGARKAT